MASVEINITLFGVHNCSVRRFNEFSNCRQTLLIYHLKSILKKQTLSVSLYVCPAMRFVVLQRIELKLGRGVGNGPPRFLVLSDTIKGHPEVKLLWKCPTATECGGKNA